VSKRVVINRKSENVYGCADESGLSDAQSCSACSEGRNGDNDSCLSDQSKVVLFMSGAMDVALRMMMK
jgi:hypothetical protein